MKDEWQEERELVLAVFYCLLYGATGDGSQKRKRGEKPPWYKDNSHEAAVFSHLNKWKHGELIDPDSSEHPLVHAAWRCLAIAFRESGYSKPGKDWMEEFKGRVKEVMNE